LLKLNSVSVAMEQHSNPFSGAVICMHATSVSILALLVSETFTYPRL
jgi:hypothetical protein